MKTFLNELLKEEVQDFIWSHEQEDVQKLLLKQKTVLGVPTEWVAQQIAGRRKAKIKLPTWYKTKGIVYPPTLNLEQCSSEATAKFKLNLLHKEVSSVADRLRITGADLTGGFGVDSYFLSRLAQQIDYIEPNEQLLALAKHNHQLLGAPNIIYHATSAEAFLASTTEEFGFLYIDPSRRKAQRKVYRLADCEPDIVTLQSKFVHKAKHILIKTSPLLDLQQGCKELKHVRQVIVLSVENDCKELLFLQHKEFHDAPTILAVDLNKEGETLNSISFTFDEERKSSVEYSSPLTYLYEPNAAILKAGAFKWIAEKFQLKKLAPSTHLYTSDHPFAFPGKVFKVMEDVKLDKKLKGRFAGGYVNILARNYPMSVEEIKKKTGLKEGGELFLICAQTQKEKISVVAERVR